MELEDRQLPRVGFTVNAAIMPRNKFNQIASGQGRRDHVLVRVDLISFGANTIIATETHDEGAWRTVQRGGSADAQVKSVSHRPIVPFKSLSGGDFYNVPDTTYPNKPFRSYIDRV